MFFIVSYTVVSLAGGLQETSFGHAAQQRLLWAPEHNEKGYTCVGRGGARRGAASLLRALCGGLPCAFHAAVREARDGGREVGADIGAGDDLVADIADSGHTELTLLEG
eukprot:gene10518-7304_t